MGEQPRDDRRVDDALAFGDPVQRVREDRDVRYPLLQQVPDPLGVLLEQTERLATAAGPLLLDSLVVGDLARAEQTLRNLNADSVWSLVTLYEADGRRLAGIKDRDIISFDGIRIGLAGAALAAWCQGRARTTRGYFGVEIEPWRAARTGACGRARHKTAIVAARRTDGRIGHHRIGAHGEAAAGVAAGSHHRTGRA